MKKLICLSLTFLIIMSCSTKKLNFPIGAWKQYSTDVYTDDILTEKTLITDNNYKLFSEKNWEFVWKVSSDSLPIYYYGAGTYTLNGTEYLETIEMHFSKPYEGQTIKMTLELKNDTLIQAWNPLDSTGMINTHVRYIEKFIHMN